MSNPGVITLASLNDNEFISFPYRFEIEDNIGEAIHIHFKDIRIDLGVKEFLLFADEVEKAFDELVDIKGFSRKDFDPVHLLGLSQSITEIEKIVLEEIELSDILCDTYSENGEEIFSSIQDSRVYKALSGIGNEDEERSQINYFKYGKVEPFSNRERTIYNLERLKLYGYPYQNQYILINNYNVIIDGQHRAACLYYLYGNQRVTVKKIIYKNQSEYMEKIPKLKIEEKEFYVPTKKQRFHSWLAKHLKRYLWKPWKQTDLDLEELKQIKLLLEELNQQIKTFETPVLHINKELEKIIKKENQILYRK